MRTSMHLWLAPLHSRAVCNTHTHPPSLAGEHPVSASHLEYYGRTVVHVYPRVRPGQMRGASQTKKAPSRHSGPQTRAAAPRAWQSVTKILARLKTESPRQTDTALHPVLARLRDARAAQVPH